MKIKRQNSILKLIENEEISTQDELSERLKQLGYNVTQATISRDIKELQLLKIPSKNKGSKYAQLGKSNNEFAEKNSDRQKLASIFNDAVISCDFAQNIIVIKTLEGMAQGVAALLDTFNNSNILGTIAGDDTVMVVTRSEEEANEMTDRIIKMLQ